MQLGFSLCLSISCLSERKPARNYFAKLAKFCVTLAMRVSVRAVRLSGYSCSRSKRDGDMMAGQRKRRNKEALMSLSLMSGRPRLLHSCRHEAKTSFSSLGKTLQNRQEENLGLAHYQIVFCFDSHVVGQSGCDQGDKCTSLYLYKTFGSPFFKFTKKSYSEICCLNASPLPQMASSTRCEQSWGKRAAANRARRVQLPIQAAPQTFPSA